MNPKLKDTLSVVGPIIAILAIGAAATTYTSKFQVAEAAQKKHESIELQIQHQQAELRSLKQLQIEQMVDRIARLRAKRNKTADDIEYLQYLGRELDRLKR